MILDVTLNKRIFLVSEPQKVYEFMGKVLTDFEREKDTQLLITKPIK